MEMLLFEPGLVEGTPALIISIMELQAGSALSYFSRHLVFRLILNSIAVQADRNKMSAESGGLYQC
jgi:hypothetical protein